jgi:RNA polymerase sigma factor (sigma-70 family)
MSPRIFNGLLPTQSDARLARLVRDGHERAFEVIVERYRRPLGRYCQRMLSEALAEDVVQQTFMHAWSALQDGMEIRDLKPWLYRVAHNAAINTLKRAGYHYEQLEDSLQTHESPDVQAERRAEMSSVLANVAALPLSQREALLRTAVDGESRSDVARHLGTTDGAVGQLLHRARTTLRAAATAITPMPLFTWGPRSGHSSGPAARIMELVGGGGGAGVTGLALKGGAVLATAGAIAGVPAAIHRIAAPAPATAAAYTASNNRPGGPDTPLVARLLGAGDGNPLMASVVIEARAGARRAAGSGAVDPLTGAPVADSSATSASGSDARVASAPSDGSGGGDGGSGGSGESSVVASASADSSGSSSGAGDVTATDNSSGTDQSSTDASGSGSTDSGSSTSSDTGSTGSGTTGSGTPSDAGAPPPDPSAGAPVAPDLTPADPSPAPAG